MKDSTIRINDTLNSIHYAQGLNGHIILRAYQLATHFINTKFPAANAGQGGYETFSKDMGLGFHLGSDSQDRRSMKRAAYVLDRAIRDAVPEATDLGHLDPKQITDSDARKVFRYYMYRAAHVQDIKVGDTYSLQLTIQELRNAPRSLMKESKFIVRGSPVRDPGQGDRNILPFHFSYEAKKNRYAFTAKVEPGSTPVSLDSITAVAWTRTPGSYAGNAVGNFAQIASIELASNLMVTTQFTGCAFCMKRTNGNVYCAHVAPTRDPADNAAPIISGTQLAQAIATSHGTAENFERRRGGALSIYGSDFSSNALAGGYPSDLGGGNYMTIIGVQNGGNYKIYSQVSRNDAIESSQRVF